MQAFENLTPIANEIIAIMLTKIANRLTSVINEELKRLFSLDHIQKILECF